MCASVRNVTINNKADTESLPLILQLWWGEEDNTRYHRSPGHVTVTDLEPTQMLDWG